jgi:hypothetical protein
MPPLALTDEQLSAVYAAAEPLVPADRSLFLQDVAAELDGKELGDGRVVREVQRRYFHPPTLDEVARQPAQLRKIGRG